jgi:hypothetical protein
MITRIKDWEVRIEHLICLVKKLVKQGKDDGPPNKEIDVHTLFYDSL